MSSVLLLTGSSMAYHSNSKYTYTAQFCVGGASRSNCVNIRVIFQKSEMKEQRKRLKSWNKNS